MGTVTSATSSRELLGAVPVGLVAPPSAAALAVEEVQALAREDRGLKQEAATCKLRAAQGKKHLFRLRKLTVVFLLALGIAVTVAVRCRSAEKPPNPAPTPSPAPTPTPKPSPKPQPKPGAARP